MSGILQVVEDTAACGARGLAKEAGADIAEALLRLRNADGGFAGLVAESDPYYTFFAWAGLRALGAAYDREGVLSYMAAHAGRGGSVDAVCARLLIRVETARPVSLGERWDCVRVILGRDVYGALLWMFGNGMVSRQIARLCWRVQKKAWLAGDFGRSPTPRLAAAAVLAWLAGAEGGAMVEALRARRCVGGGYASAAGARPDLLGTAVARTAMLLHVGAAGIGGGESAEDLAFCEACWQADGLFGPLPDSGSGDAEHTYYGLLALGACRLRP